MAICNGLCALARKITGEELVFPIHCEQDGSIYNFREVDVVNWETAHQSEKEET